MTVLGYIGEKLDLLVKQGSTLGPFRVTLLNVDQTPVNLTDCTVRGHVRKKALSADITALFAVSITEAATGKFEFGLPDEITAAIPAGETLKDPLSLYVWDMELEDALGRVMPLYYGDCKVFREVTRA
jgi:hypothetical protein